MREEVEPDWPSLIGLMPKVGPLTLDWSPDGQWLAVPLSLSDHTMRLIIINTHTKEIEADWIDYPIPTISNEIRSLQWSPDSKRIAIVYQSAIYTPELGREASYHILNVETKEVETDWPESSFRSLNHIRWSLDGEFIVLINNFGQAPNLQVININTREIEPGWPTGWPRIQDAAWSYDSQLLAISSHESPYLIILDRDSKGIDHGWQPILNPSQKLSWSPHHDPPGAPTDVELSRTAASAVLSWHPPENPNILDYRITIEPAEQVDGPADYLVFDANRDEYLIEGLHPDIDYTVSIRAISVFGVGDAAISSMH